MRPGSEECSRWTRFARPARPKPARPVMVRRPSGARAGASYTANQAGFTLVEMIVGFALLSLVVGAILIISGASWRAEIKAYTGYQAQWMARSAMNVIVNGDSEAIIPVQGLRRASAVTTVPTSSVLAYRVTWKDAADVVHDQTITYWRSDNSLYRSIVPYVAPLTPSTTGGTLVTSGVTGFSLSADGAIPVEILLTIGHPQGSGITLQTRVTPRNLGSG